MLNCDKLLNVNSIYVSIQFIIIWNHWILNTYGSNDVSVIVEGHKISQLPKFRKFLQIFSTPVNKENIFLLYIAYTKEKSLLTYQRESAGEKSTRKEVKKLFSY